MTRRETPIVVPHDWGLSVVFGQIKIGLKPTGLRVNIAKLPELLRGTVAREAEKDWGH
jgi:hypothetical protein